MKARFKVTSQRWRAEEVIDETSHGIEDGLRLAGDYMVDEADPIVPYELGSLGDSAKVDADRDWAVVSYDTVYAARLHEHPEFSFDGGRQGKWLERVLFAAVDRFPQVVGAAIGRVWR